MSLIIATGSNIGNSLVHLNEAKEYLSEKLQMIAESRVYSSAAVDYENQPDFLNQVLEFALPASKSPDEVMRWLLAIEKQMGRERNISKGPRVIDLDIIFWGTEAIRTQHVIIPHPHWNERSFVVKPLMELPFFQTIQKCFTIPRSFNVEATPLGN